MKHLTRLFMLLLLVGMAPAAWAEPWEEVASATEQWARNFSADNPAPILALYDKDAVLLGAASPTLREDPAAIRDYFEETFAGFPHRKVTLHQSIGVYGNTAVNTGYWTFSGVNLKGKTTTVRVRYILTYVMRNRRWMIVGDPRLWRHPARSATLLVRRNEILPPNGKLNCFSGRRG